MKSDIMKLSQCCTSIADGDHQPPPKADAGISFVTISNIVSNRFDFTNTMYVPEEYYRLLDDKRKAKKGDILYSVVGSFGIPVLIKDDVKFVFQRHIAILRPNEEVIDSRFLYYVMLGSDFYAKADAAAIGAAQRTISLTALRNMEISVPNIETQHRIADILSAYDDLIENNRKQIKLLEEAAQRLYKEWFVDLRFPGWENTRIVDGVPERWSLYTLSEISPILTGKKDANYGTEDGMYPFFTCSQELIKAPDYSFDASAVILAGNGDFNVKLYRGKFEAYQRTYVLSPKNEEYLYLLYNAVRMSMQELFVGAAGSTIKFLTKGMIERISVIVPSQKILMQYNSFSENTQREIENCKQKIHLATEARDRLLPKLMSGEIEV